jgi:hypothetical protein
MSLNRDSVLSDTNSYDSNSVALPETGENDTPDRFEKSRAYRADIQQYTSDFQFFVLDLKQIRAEKTLEHFVFKSYETVRHEMRWMSYSLENWDGSPDENTGINDPRNKYYRTNFWSAEADPLDSDVFYLSHRAEMTHGSSLHSNNIVKVTIRGNPRPKLNADGTWTSPLTRKVFAFKRVFGFKSKELSPETLFPSDFKITMIRGEKILIVNSFRDHVDFQEPRYVLAASSLDPRYPWVSYLDTKAMGESYFNLAVGRNGSILTTAFFSNQLSLLALDKTQKLQKVKTIE